MNEFFRLTYWSEEYECWTYHGASGDMAKQLANYENTDLSPSEIATLLQKAKITLKEKQERESGCGECNGSESMPFVYPNDDMCDVMRANYCPMCGRDLRGEG